MKNAIKAVIAVVVLAGAASAGLLDDIKGQTSALAVSSVDSRASLTADEQAKLQTYIVSNYRSQADNKGAVEAILATLKSKNIKVAGVRPFTETYNNGRDTAYRTEISYVSPDGSYIDSHLYYNKSELDTMRRLGLTVFRDIPWEGHPGCGSVLYLANEAKGEVLKTADSSSLTWLASKTWLDAHALAYKAKGYAIIRTDITLVREVMTRYYEATIIYMPLNR